MRASKRVPLTAPPFGALFWLRFSGHSCTYSLRYPQFSCFFLIFEVPMSTMVTHYESQQGDAVEGTPLWGIFLTSVQWPFRHLFPEVPPIWFFLSHFWGAYEHDGYALWEPPRGCRWRHPLWGIFLASVQRPIRPLKSKVAAIWFFPSRLWGNNEQDGYTLWEPPRGCRWQHPPLGHFFGFGSAVVSPKRCPHLVLIFRKY
jgi:hypothetical protein